MSSLLTCVRKEIRLAEALRAFPTGSHGPVALVYTPSWCGFATLKDGALIDSAGRAIEGAYEVRVFDDRAELRWLNNPAANGTGTATLLTADAGTKCPPDWEPAERNTKMPDIGTNGLTYLLWGEHAAPPQPLRDGWSMLGLARIGALPVPLADVKTGQRVVLTAVEYIAADEFGSAFVFEERLTGLAIHKESGNG